MEITQNLLDRAKRTWEEITKEPITVEGIKGVLYAFGSELAMLRLNYKMGFGRVGYSENMQSWYWVNEKS